MMLSCVTPRSLVCPNCVYGSNASRGPNLNPKAVISARMSFIERDLRDDSAGLEAVLGNAITVG